MKIITAILQPFMLSRVTHALEEVEGFPGMTVTDARGFGREKSLRPPGTRHSITEDLTDFVEKSRVEIVAPDEMVDSIVGVITRVAHTGRGGDGKVFVWPVEHAVRIQTGETGDGALR